MTKHTISSLHTHNRESLWSELLVKKCFFFVVILPVAVSPIFPQRMKRIVMVSRLLLPWPCVCVCVCMKMYTPVCPGVCLSPCQQVWRTDGGLWSIRADAEVENPTNGHHFSQSVATHARAPADDVPGGGPSAALMSWDRSFPEHCSLQVTPFVLLIFSSYLTICCSWSPPSLYTEWGEVSTTCFWTYSTSLWGLKAGCLNHLS